MFAVSDKVVCVDDTGQDISIPYPTFDRVHRDQTYVIRGFSSCDGLYLVGLCGGYWAGGEEVGWKPRRFRKLAEIKAENALRAAIDQSISRP